MKRSGIDFGVMMLDLDLFKDINDTHGHNIGDSVLKMVADTFQGSMRKNDFIGRWGGEEFVAALRGVNQAELETIAKKVCKLVEQSSLKRAGDEIRVTVSIGATMIRPTDNAYTLIHRADSALYTSKREGRNRVTVL
ncbi:MAG: GGDEF domain-containing protein [Eubacteriales bacterium]